MTVPGLRTQLEVDDLDDTVSGLRQAGVGWRSGAIGGRGGQQAIVEDPSGTLVELFEPRS